MINQIKRLPNGFVATASSDNTSKIWDPSISTSWILIRTFMGHFGRVFSLEYINTDTIATGAEDRTIKIWSISSGSELLTINTTSSVYCLKLLSKEFYLAAGFFNGFINIYDIRNGSLINILIGHTNQINDLVLIDSGDTLASSSNDNTTRIWNLTTNTFKFNLTGHTNFVRGLKQLSTDILASGSNDRTIKLWSILNGTLIRTLINHTSVIYWSLDLLIDGQTLVSGSLDQTIKMWNWKTGQCLNTIETGLAIRSLAVFNGSITGNYHHSIKILN